MNVKNNGKKDHDPLVLKISFDVRSVDELAGLTCEQDDDSTSLPQAEADGHPMRLGMLLQPKSDPEESEPKIDLGELLADPEIVGLPSLEAAQGVRLEPRQDLPLSRMARPGMDLGVNSDSDPAESSFLPEDGDADIEFTLVVYV